MNVLCFLHTGTQNCYGKFIVDYLTKFQLQQHDFFVPSLKRVHGGWDINLPRKQRLEAVGPKKETRMEINGAIAAAA